LPVLHADPDNSLGVYSKGERQVLKGPLQPRRAGHCGERTGGAKLPPVLRAGESGSAL